MTLQPTPSLLASTVLNGRSVANESAFANTTAALASGNATSDSVFGINQSGITVSSPGSVLGTVVANLIGTAISVDGNGDADAGSLTGSSLVGISGDGSTGFVSIGGTGSVQGSLLASLTAAGTSTSGNADASAGALGAIGIRAGDTTVAGDGTIAGLAQLTQSATARSTAGSVNADSQVTNLFGLTTGPTAPSLQIAGTGALYGAASLVATATAATIGDDATVDAAIATQKLTTGTGLDLNGSIAAAAVSSIGGASAITGQVEVAGTANASATTGNSSAISDGGNLSGIRLSDATPLQGNGASVVTGAASGVLTARATTTSGESGANVDGNVFGVNGGAGAIKIGANGVLNASALLDATAVASTIDGLGNNATAQVTPASGAVTGLQLGNSAAGLSINGSGTVIGTAQTNQLASASTVSSGNAVANVVGATQPIIGIDGTAASPITSPITIGGNAQDVIASSVLNANANATSVAGNTRAESVLGDVTGLNRSTLEINGNSLGDIRATANVSETLSATTIGGTADSNTATGYIFGSHDSTLTVDGSGSVETAGNLNLVQLAQSTSGTSAKVNDPGINQNVGGFWFGNVSIGSNGSFDSTANTSLNQRALNVTGNAESYSSSGTWATQLASSDTERVGINGSGSISSKASTTGLVEAVTVSGAAVAMAGNSNYGLVVIGTSLTGNDSFSIQGSGNIINEAKVGSSLNPFTIRAVSVDGIAEATQTGGSTANIVGIDGMRDLNLLTNQKSTFSTSSGAISSSASTYLQLTASSVDGNARSGTFGTTSGDALYSTSGTNDARFVIADTTNSQVSSTSFADLGATSRSVGGDSTARLEVKSGGLFGINNSADKRSSIQAANTTGISQVAATSVASTVLGNSLASNLRTSNTADNPGLSGISNYLINALGSGTLTAASTANMKSFATSIAGSATGTATL